MGRKTLLCLMLFTQLFPAGFAHLRVTRQSHSLVHFKDFMDSTTVTSTPLRSRPPYIQLEDLGERCKLPYQRGLECSPSKIEFWYILALKYDILHQQFNNFPDFSVLRIYALHGNLVAWCIQSLVVLSSWLQSRRPLLLQRLP